MAPNEAKSPVPDSNDSRLFLPPPVTSHPHPLTHPHPHPHLQHLHHHPSQLLGKRSQLSAGGALEDRLQQQQQQQQQQRQQRQTMFGSQTVDANSATPYSDATQEEEEKVILRKARKRK
ncbi:GATA zinc finger domain-containing protein 10-like [Penaeus japonicus]|uniref:GATA zinc finger domain-containing protein 10-like n=1 Tax=Penaeus japonicus TaxID=27405 RepID=UPI001C70B3FE|nr:GATA zinc finger domain-containing protein 10-like [Penaeus japonicus]